MRDQYAGAGHCRRGVQRERRARSLAAHHGGEELVFLLEGTLIYELENYKSYTLEKYDTLYYPNYIGHRWVNASDENAKMLIISTSPYKF